MYKTTVHTSIGQDSPRNKQEICDTPTAWNFPSWEIELEDIIVEERQLGVELVCVSKGLMSPTAKWFHKGKEVFSDFHMKLKQIANKATLTIKSIREQDNGKFKCVMTGDNGELETSCVLSLKEPDRIEPPVFVKELHDVEVEEGDKMELVTEVRGTPHIGVFWYHNNVEITPDSPHFLLASLGQVHTLTILHATANSSGEYVCEAYNDFGDTDTFCFLEVREVEHPEPPDFVTCPSSVTATEGHSVTFTCQVKGQPMPTVLWEREDVFITTSQKYKITKIQDQHSLTVHNVDQSDAGQYTCHLHSADRNTSHVCSLVIIKFDSIEYGGIELTESRSLQIESSNVKSKTDKSSQKVERSSMLPDSSWIYKNRNLKSATENVKETINSTTSNTNFHRSAKNKTPTTKMFPFVQETEGGNHNSYFHPQQAIHSGNHDIPRQQEIFGPHVINKIIPDISENLSGSTLSNSIVNKSHNKTREVKHNVNSDTTDFRSVLKSRDKKITPHVSKSEQFQPNKADFRNVLSHDKFKTQSDSHITASFTPKGSNVSTQEVLDASTINSSSTLFSQSHHLTMYNDPTTSNSSTNHLNINRPSATNKSNIRVESNIINSKLTYPQQDLDISENLYSNIKFADKIGQSQAAISSSPTEKSSNHKEQQASSSSSSCNVRAEANTMDIKHARKEVDTSAELENKDKGHNKCGNNGQEDKLFKTEIQVFETRLPGKRDVSNLASNEQIKIVAAIQRRPISENKEVGSDDYSNAKDKFKFESEKLTSSDKEIIKQSHSTSSIQFSPQLSTSPPDKDEFKLEVTSVSFSMPLRSSASSMWPQSDTVSDESSADNLAMYQENTDSVFTELTDENINKQSLHSLGPMFTWEKAPWVNTEVQQNNLPDEVSTPTQTKVTTVAENVSSNRRSSLLENREQSLDSVTELISKSDKSISYRTKHTDSGIDSSCKDSENVTYRSSAIINKPTKLNYGNNASSSIPCVFADVKLKPISKAKEPLSDSQTFSKTDTKGEYVESFSKFSQDRLLKNINNTEVYTISDQRTKSSLNQIHIRPRSSAMFEKQVQDSKIKLVAEQFENPVAYNLSRIKSGNKFQEFASKFEERAADTKEGNKNMQYVSPSLNKISPADKPQAKSVGKLVDKIQQRVETDSSGKTEKKMLKEIGKSNSNSSILNSGHKSHVDKVQERPEQRRLSLQMDRVPSLSKTDNDKPHSEGVDITNKEFIKPSQTSEKTEMGDQAQVINIQSGTEQKTNLFDAKQKQDQFENIKKFNELLSTSETEHRHVKVDVSTDKSRKEYVIAEKKDDNFADENVKKNNFKTEVNNDFFDGQIRHFESRIQSELQKVHTNTDNKQMVSKSLESERNSWVNRKNVCDIEAKIKENRKFGNQQNKTRSDLATVRPSSLIQQINGDKNKSKHQLSSDNIITSNNKEQIIITSSRNANIGEVSTAQLFRTNITNSSLKQVESSSIDEASYGNQFNVKSHAFKQFPDACEHKLQNTSAQNNDCKLQAKTISSIITTTTTVSSSSIITTTANFVSPPSTSTNPAWTESFLIDSRKDKNTQSTNIVSSRSTNRNTWITSKKTVDNSEESQILENSNDSTLKPLISNLQFDENNQSEINILSDQTDGESLVSNQQTKTGVRQSWQKEICARSVPSYPSLEPGLSLPHEVLGSSLDDSESILSTASISSSSSDASNVTIDSGYPRHTLTTLIDDKFSAANKALHFENYEHYKTNPHSRKLCDVEVETNEVLHTKHTLLDAPEKIDINIKGDYIVSESVRRTQTDERRINKFQVRDEIKKKELFYTSTKSEITDTQRNKTIVNKFEQKEFTKESLNKTQGNNSPHVSKENKNVTSAKDNEEIADLSHDFGTIRKYSKKRRKTIEKQASDATEAGADNKVVSRSNIDAIKARFSRRFTENETNIETNRKTSRVTEKQNESSRRWKSTETTTLVKSNEANIDPNVQKIERFQQTFSEYKSSALTSCDNSKQAVIRPSDLDLNPKWKSSSSQFKKNSVLISKEIPAGDNRKNIVNATEAAVKPADKPVTPAVSEIQPGPCPPSFPQPLQDTLVMFGSKAVLRCRILGNPKPEIKWLFNQTLIESSRNIEILNTEETAQLIVHETFTEHVGNYSCWAKNSMGTVSSHCCLSLEAFNRTESRALEGRRFVPPKIMFLNPSTVSLPCGSPMTLSMSFIGEPVPTVKWMQGDIELVSDGHVEIITEGNSSSLSIKSVSQSDAGKMSVCLSSCTGSDQALVNVCIEDVPGSPAGKPHIYDIDSSSVSLSWYGPTCSEGNLITHFVIEAKSQPEQAWDVIVPHCKDVSCHILGLTPCTAYQFRVLAANKHGLSAPSDHSEWVITSDTFRSSSDYESEDDFPFEPREVKVNTKDKFEDVFELDKEVGKGKFGIVYKCKHRKDGTVWAAKIVKCREKDKGVIRREIDIMNKLRHPKLLLLWDAYESPRQMVLVMEYVGAGELFERVIGEDFVLTECDCVHFLRQICEGVNYMHNNNILHLDLKPENILCISEDSNRIKIIDFGLAQFYEEGQSTKVLFGTPEFIAPEVINYEEIGFVTDMWSIGVICYVLLSGLSPFLGDNDAETLANVTSGEFDFDDEAFDEISEEAKHFISELLIMRKEKRMLTNQCLAHVWLNPKDVGGFRRRRLNTERLKRFMVRRKWLKTGNAVLAVSRFLRYSHLSNQSSVNSNNYELNSPESNSAVSISSVQRNVKALTESKDLQNEQVLAANSSAKFMSNDYRIQGVSAESQCIKEMSAHGYCGDSHVTAMTLVKKVASEQILTNLAQGNVSVGDTDKFSREPQTSRRRDLNQSECQANQNMDQNDNQIMNNYSQNLATGVHDVNHNTDQSTLSTSSESLNSSTVAKNEEITNTKQNIPTVYEDIAKQVPVFTKSMKSSSTCVGDVARFDVVVAGNPIPTVTWYLDGEEIQPDSRHTIDCNQTSGSFSLVIRSIEEEDEGEYTCKAVNSQGESICAAELSVFEM